MTSIIETESKKQEESFNPGEIIEIDGWPRWRTHVGPFELILDIVPVGESEKGKSEIGIASFVVMEQEAPFLEYVATQLTEAIVSQTTGERVLLMTVESKGSYFAPWVWNKLVSTTGKRLEKRIIVLRKGEEAKLYMKRPAIIDSQEVALPQTSFFSITSASEQKLNISPRDAEFLLQAATTGVEPIAIDDFIGKGGTIVAVCQLFRQLGLKPPPLLAVVGSDSNLYEKTFREEGMDISLLPQPLPLRLPTFIRESLKTPWQVNN